MTNLAIIGLGKIGKAFFHKAKKEGYDIPLIVEYNGVFTDFNLKNKIDEPENYLKHFKSNNINVACLTIPTFDDGETGRDIILSCAGNGIPVATSEKGALGNFYPELKDKISMIGYRATVGGGSRILPFLKEQGDNIKEIHVINNGTLNYIFEGLGMRRPLEDLISKAKELGYAEPGASDALEIINNEMSNDIPKKTAILYNTANLGEIIRATDIKASPLTKEQFQKINPIFYRFMVSFYKDKKKKSEKISGFDYETNDWKISAGFKYTPDMHNCYPLPKGVENGIYIVKGESNYVVYSAGPGAGADPTTDSLMKDIRELSKKSS